MRPSNQYTKQNIMMLDSHMHACDEMPISSPAVIVALAGQPQVLLLHKIFEPTIRQHHRIRHATPVVLHHRRACAHA